MRGTAAAAHRFHEMPQRRAGYQLPMGATLDLCPPSDVPSTPQAVLDAVEVVRARHESLQRRAGELREAESVLADAELVDRRNAVQAAGRDESSGENPLTREARVKVADAERAVEAHEESWRLAYADLAAAIWASKSKWLDALSDEVQKIRKRALGRLDLLQQDADQIDRLAVLASGIADIYEGGSLTAIRLSAEHDTVLRDAQRQHAREQDRAHLYATVSSDIDSLVSALLARFDPPPGSEQLGRAVW